MNYAITLHEPYASLVAIGIKQYETRAWSTNYHGDILIHAARRWDRKVRADWDRAERIVNTRCGEEYRRLWPGLKDDRPETLGCVVATAMICDVREMLEPPCEADGLFGTFGPGRYGWMLKYAQRLTRPVPWRCFQRLWKAPDKLMELIEAQLPEPVGAA